MGTRVRRLISALGIAVAIWVVTLRAAGCTGSGTTWTCSTGTTPSQINTTLSSATDGATLTFDAGSYSWGGTTITPSSTKAVTLICATAPPASAPWGAATSGGCNVTASGGVVKIPNATTSKLYRVSGFNVTGGPLVNACPGGNCADTYVTSLRIDHNTVTVNGVAILFFSDNQTSGYVEGVSDHNIYKNAQTTNWADFFFESSSPPTGNRLGTVHNFFFEDDSFLLTGTGSDDGNGAGCMDGAGGIGLVVRFSTSDDCRFLLHGQTHGAPTNWEVYYNTLSKKPAAALDDGYRLIHHQGGGTFMVFENVLAQSSGSGHNGSAMAVLEYRSFTPGGASPLCDGTQGIDGNRTPLATYRGYPCNRQSGRELDGTMKPMYVWRNRWADDGSKVDLNVDAPGGTTDYTSLHLVANRDLYNAVSANAQTSKTSPFNGTTGMGFGTLANRPDTCTPTSESADAGQGGVGYWATDGGTNWRTDNGSGNDGGLYTCTATDTWTLTYTPYTYPHPLVGGAPAADPGHLLPFLIRPGDQQQ